MEAIALSIITEIPGTAKGDMPGLMRQRGVRGQDARMHAAVDRLIMREAVKIRLGGKTDRAHLLYPKGFET